MAMLRIDDSSSDNDGMFLTSRLGIVRVKATDPSMSGSGRMVDILPAALVKIEGLQVRPSLDQPSKFVVV